MLLSRGGAVAGSGTIGEKQDITRKNERPAKCRFTEALKTNGSSDCYRPSNRTEELVNRCLSMELNGTFIAIDKEDEQVS